MIRTIRAIVRKELIQLLRDKRMYLPLFVAPVIQLILFGYAASVDVRDVASNETSTSSDRSNASAELLTRAVQDPPAEGLRAGDPGRARVAVPAARPPAGPADARRRFHPRHPGARCAHFGGNLDGCGGAWP